MLPRSPMSMRCSISAHDHVLCGINLLLLVTQRSWTICVSPATSHTLNTQQIVSPQLDQGLVRTRHSTAEQPDRRAIYRRSPTCSQLLIADLPTVSTYLWGSKRDIRRQCSTSEGLQYYAVSVSGPENLVSYLFGSHLSSYQEYREAY